jgi:hypothetical protein
LDLSDVGTDTVKKAALGSWFARHWGLLVFLVVLVIIAMTGLAFFPETGVVGKQGTRTSVIRVNNPLRALKNVGRGRTLGVGFSEQDINGYMRYYKAPKMKVDSLSVFVGEGYFNVRLIRSVDLFKVGSFSLEPKVSYDFAFVPRGGLVRARKATMGRLPLFGPLKHSAVRNLYALLAAQPEWAAFGSVSEVAVENGKIRVTVKN